MSVYIDVWHRVHPLTPATHARFLDYYATHVVAPPSDFFEVVAGFRYTDGGTNEDFALYRYESMAAIEESMQSFGADPGFVRATETLFADIEIEETRAIALHLPSERPESSETSMDALIAESPAPDEPARRFVRSVRICSASERPRVFEALAERQVQIESAGRARLVAGFHYVVGPVMDLVEIWLLPERIAEWSESELGVAPDLAAELAVLAPERERRGIAPTGFSKLR